MNRSSDLTRFYLVLSKLKKRLGGVRTLAQCHGRMGWPQRGIYFFFENSEKRFGQCEEARVVRVGTHALKLESRSSLWQRLSQHRGTNAGGGNHRGSIFRLLVGESMKGEGRFHEVVSWDVGNDIPYAANQLMLSRAAVGELELPLEMGVSEYIRAMPFLWIAVEDESGAASHRGIIERGSIALLSNYGRTPIDPASATWLGTKCSRERVRASGLWNNNHVQENYDPAFLDVLEHYVENTFLNLT